MMAWLPIFFLFYNKSLGIRDIILLESVYYIAVVALEVPSGYFSDRLGRKITLIISSITFSAAYFIFGLGTPSFFSFAIAQVLFACGYSFMSGTDTSFYFESLQRDGLGDVYPEREAKVQSWAGYAGAIAALIGGYLGSIELSYGYLISLAFMIPALLITLRFEETKSDEEYHNSVVQQAKTIWNYTKLPELKWMFWYSVIIYVLIHIPYEFYQPYISLLEEGGFSLPFEAAVYSGILFAGTRFFGAIASGQSIRLTKLLGLKMLCFISITMQLLLIGIWGYFFESWVILLIFLRSISMSLTTAPINAEIAPRINKNQRATYFSFQSLVSRLSFSVALILLSIPISHQVINDWPTLSAIFKYSLYGGILISAPLVFIRSGALFGHKVNTNS